MLLTWDMGWDSFSVPAASCLCLLSWGRAVSLKGKAGGGAEGERRS